MKAGFHWAKLLIDRGGPLKKGQRCLVRINGEEPFLKVAYAVAVDVTGAEVLSVDPQELYINPETI